MTRKVMIFHGIPVLRSLSLVHGVLKTVILVGELWTIFWSVYIQDVAGKSPRLGSELVVWHFLFFVFQ